MSIHKRIKEGRIKLGLTEQQFGERVGVSRGAVQQWEKEGGTAPNRKRQADVAKLLGVSVAELMSTDNLPHGTFYPTFGHREGVTEKDDLDLAYAKAENEAQCRVWQQEIVDYYMQLRSGTRPAGSPPISAALGIDAIAHALTQMTDAQRETMAGKLAALARAPDSPTLKKSISESLGSPPLTPPDS